MKSFLCLVAVCSFAQLLSPVLAGSIHPCVWKQYDKTNIPGGTKQLDATTVAQCQSKCEADPNCQSVDFDSSNVCWFLTTTSGMQPNPYVTHYECVAAPTTTTTTTRRPTTTTTTTTTTTPKPPCQSQNIFVLGGISGNIITNYPQSITDLFGTSVGVSWSFNAPSFKFDWPSWLLPGCKIKRLEVVSSVNLASANLRVFDRNGQPKLLDGSIAAGIAGILGVSFSSSLSISGGFTLEIALVPIDFTLPIKVDDMLLWYCPDAFCVLPKRNLFADGDIRKYIPSWPTGGFSGTLPNPFVEVNIGGFGFGYASPTKIGFGRATGIAKIKVQLWAGGVPVQVVDRFGVSGTVFGFDQGTTQVSFGSGGAGDKLRVEFIPASFDSTGFGGSISFGQLHIFVLPSRC